ncbi:MAG: tetrahydrofolate dehydrogenase/cyclohydrolase catalytic domain-containing protein, partial [Candidatus Eisenbacteria bacterium]|nr:tetrahydrofolate dehydrogenase/cyclohydrolase catalytic domain-containing protein [Candidatus Eisenbacteria bacterium]
MTARILDGKRVAAEIRQELAARVEALRPSGVTPRISLIRVGEDPASVIYVRNKAKACAEVGIESEVLVLPAETADAAIARAIEERSADPRVHGILLQLPLPGGRDPFDLLQKIDPCKDVDGFHPENVGRLCLGVDGFVPCTPLGIVELLRRHDIPLAGRHVAVIGRSATVGRPLANLLLRKEEGLNATVSMLHTASREPWEITSRADVVVAAAGRRALVDARWIGEGAAVVDVGMHRGDDGKLYGDVDAAPVAEKAGWLSPCLLYTSDA